MKKYYKIIFILVTLLVVFSIYKLFPKQKLNYIALGDSVVEGRTPYGETDNSYADYFYQRLNQEGKIKYYTKEYSHSGYQTNDIINDIIRDGDIKRDLRESDLVTISIGANDFLASIDLKNVNASNLALYRKNIESILPKIEECIKEVRKYAKNKFYIIGYYNPIPFLFSIGKEQVEDLFRYIDKEYQKIADKYDCTYISNYELFKNHPEYLPNPLDIHPNLDGHRAIAEALYQEYKKQTTKKY